MSSLKLKKKILKHWSLFIHGYLKNRCPAFHLALNGFIGVALFFFFNPYLFTFWLLQLLIFAIYQRYTLLFSAISAACALFTYCHASKILPSLPKEGFSGTALYKIDSINELKGHFGKGVILKGTLLHFRDESGSLTAKNVPCSIYLKESWKIPDPSFIYAIPGKLISKKSHQYSLKIQFNASWKVVKKTYSLEKWRCQFKEYAAKYIRKQFSNEEAGNFITGLSLGIVEGFTLKKDLNALGLQHIIAISGFHFTLISLVMFRLFNTISSHRLAIVLTLLMMSLYFLMLGYSPSIFRAWVMSSLFLLSLVLLKQSNSLNNLGIALLITLLIEPFDIFNLGFQFSYLATFGLITVYPLFENMLKNFFSLRQLSELRLLKTSAQLGHMTIFIFLKVSALNLAAHLTTVPLVLFAFHQFPLGSLVYNLFSPILVTFSLLLTIGGVFCLPLGTISEKIFELNNFYTNLLIDICQNPLFSKVFYIQSFNIDLLIMMIGITISLGLYSAVYRKKELIGLNYL